jgi:hypothetical protein
VREIHKERERERENLLPTWERFKKKRTLEFSLEKLNIFVFSNTPTLHSPTSRLLSPSISLGTPFPDPPSVCDTFILYNNGESLFLLLIEKKRGKWKTYILVSV